MALDPDEAQRIIHALALVHGQGLRTCLMAWTMVVGKIIEGLKLDGIRKNLAAEVYEAWGMLRPYTMVLEGYQHQFPGPQERTLRKYYDTTWITAGLVRTMLAVAQGADLSETDEAVIQQVQNFCDDTLREIDGISAQGPIGCTAQAFRNHIYHLKNLMMVVLGPQGPEFQRQYDEAMTSLNQYTELVDAPRN